MSLKTKTSRDHLPPPTDKYSKYKNTKTTFRKKQVLNSAFEIDSNFEILNAVGQGAYGLVVAAKNKATPKGQPSLLAIKKIEKAFEHRIFAKRTLRELRILRLLHHENIIGIQNLLLPKSREEFDDIYVCMELMETDLASIIKSSQKLSYDHIKFFLYQILRGLKYIHSAGIVHRDLKPRNLLINSNCDLKICDFGLARAMHFKNTPKEMTSYVATRWYRPPELLLETKEYGPGIDMWSVGCILAEMIKRRPFLPGTDTTSQLELIFNMFGTPTEEDIAGVDQVKARQFLRFTRKKEGKNLEKVVFPGTDPMILDLIKKMLTFNPKKRITVEEALRHPYLADLYCPEDEPVREFVSAGEFEYEKHDLQLNVVKDLLYEEILLYHFPEFRDEYSLKVLKNEIELSNGNGNLLQKNHHHHEKHGNILNRNGSKSETESGRQQFFAKENICLG